MIHLPRFTKRKYIIIYIASFVSYALKRECSFVSASPFLCIVSKMRTEALSIFERGVVAEIREFSVPDHIENLSKNEEYFQLNLPALLRKVSILRFY